MVRIAQSTIDNMTTDTMQEVMDTMAGAISRTSPLSAWCTAMPFHMSRNRSLFTMSFRPTVGNSQAFTSDDLCAFEYPEGIPPCELFYADCHAGPDSTLVAQDNLVRLYLEGNSIGGQVSVDALTTVYPFLPIGVKLVESSIFSIRCQTGAGSDFAPLHVTVWGAIDLVPGPFL